LLAWLGAFDQHAASLAGEPAMPAKRPDPVEQAVGAFYSLDRDHPPPNGYRALADVEGADRASRRPGGIQVQPILPPGRATGDPALGRQQIGQDFMRPQNLDATGFDVGDQ